MSTALKTGISLILGPDFEESCSVLSEGAKIALYSVLCI